MIEFEFQRTADTMDGKNPDLGAFKSNLRAIIPDREFKLDKNAASVSNLKQNTKDP